MNNATLITVIGSIVVALIGGFVALYTNNANNKLLAKNKQLDFELEKQKLETKQSIIKYDVVTNLLKFSQYQKIYDAVIKLMGNSKVDRFLIFIAVNGKTELSNVTCIFQKFRGDKATLDAVAVYKNLKVDDEYVRLLKKMELENGITLHTEELSQSLIKDIYENEKVIWSRWEFFGRISIDENNDIITFGSCATFDKESFTTQDMLAIKLNIKGVVAPEIIKTVKEMNVNNLN